MPNMRMIPDGTYTDTDNWEYRKKVKITALRSAADFIETFSENLMLSPDEQKSRFYQICYDKAKKKNIIPEDVWFTAQNHAMTIK